MDGLAITEGTGVRPSGIQKMDDTAGGRLAIDIELVNSYTSALSRARRLRLLRDCRRGAGQEGY